MKIRAAVTAVAAMGAVLAMSPAAEAARNYDKQDPYKTGCASSAIVSKQSTLTAKGTKKPAGTIKLMWSRHCKTNWTEIWVHPRDRGIIRVIRTLRDGKTIDKKVEFSYGSGNGGHHWGNMVVAPGLCAWGYATAKHPKSWANGYTAKACG